MLIVYVEAQYQEHVLISLNMQVTMARGKAKTGLKNPDRPPDNVETQVIIDFRSLDSDSTRDFISIHELLYKFS